MESSNPIAERKPTCDVWHEDGYVSIVIVASSVIEYPADSGELCPGLRMTASQALAFAETLTAEVRQMLDECE